MATLKNTKIDDTGYLGVPTGSNAQRPNTASAGMIRWNTDNSVLEGHDGTEWKQFSLTEYVKTYSVTDNTTSTNEGTTITFTITTDNVPDGSTLYYTLSGVDSNDVSTGTSGNFTINNNSGSVDVSIANDETTEGSETLTFQVRTDSTSGTIVSSDTTTINDTSITPGSPPTWNTGAGGLGTVYTERSESVSVSASSTDSGTVSYSVVSGNLPGGYSLNSSNGTISGTGTGVSDYNSTVYTFTVRASSTTGYSADRNFSITLTSRYVGYQCATAGEGGTVSDTAPSGMVFNRVDFSSYGTPNGSCGSFTLSGCHSSSSGNYNPTPTTSYSVSATNGTWGDPCRGTGKRMYIQMSYGPF